jgi:transposase
MDSLSEIVDVVIGVDTHVRTHSAAAVNARTGGVLGEITVEATPQGYDELVEFASEHEGLRAWAIEGTGSHGAGLTRCLAKNEEVVVELDRPERPLEKPSAGPSSAPHGQPASARRSQCCWRRGDQRSRQPWKPANSCLPWSSPHPSNYGRSFAASARWRWRKPQRVSESRPSGISKPG